MDWLYSVRSVVPQVVSSDSYWKPNWPITRLYIAILHTYVAPLLMQPTLGSSVYEPTQCVLKRIRAVLTTNLQFINTNWHSHVHNNSWLHRLHYRIYTPKHAGILWWMPYSSYVRTTYVYPWDSTPSHVTTHQIPSILFPVQRMGCSR